MKRRLIHICLFIIVAYLYFEYTDYIRRLKPPINKHLKEVTPKMVFVKGGEYTTGKKYDGPYSVEMENVQKVLVKDFYISNYEITIKEFCEFVNASGETKKLPKYIVKKNNLYVPQGGFGNYPIIDISWEMAKKYCIWRGGRLPTEIEWEYASQGGHKSLGFKYSGSNILNEVAWHYGNAGRNIQPVGQKLPNELGLFDMNGNVWEFCMDDYRKYQITTPIEEWEDDFHAKVVKGGSVLSFENKFYFAMRYHCGIGGGYYQGFRFVKVSE